MRASLTSFHRDCQGRSKRQGPTGPVALGVVDSQSAQLVERRLILNAFGDRLDLELARATPMIASTTWRSSSSWSRLRTKRVLGLLLDVARGHPQRSMMLAAHLFARTPAGGAADEAPFETPSRTPAPARRDR